MENALNENSTNTESASLNTSFKIVGMRYVLLSFHLLNWQYTKFTMRFPENSYIFAIKVQYQIAIQIIILKNFL